MSHFPDRNEFSVELDRSWRQDRSQWALLVIASAIEDGVSVLGEISTSLDQIRVTLQQSAAPHLISARITVMPKSIVVGSTAIATVRGFDQFGQPFPITDPTTVVPSASVPGDVTLAAPTLPGDGSAAFVVTGVNSNPDDAIGATIGTVVAATDSLTITAPSPVLTTATTTLS